MTVDKQVCKLPLFSGGGVFTRCSWIKNMTMSKNAQKQPDRGLKFVRFEL